MSGWIVIGIVTALALLLFWILIIYNGLVAMRQRVSQAFANIDVQLKQRHDLVPNLVETVKGYAAHERSTLDAVVHARNAAIRARGPAAQAATENMLTGALRQLFALSEAYPNLKANTNFQQCNPTSPTSRTSSPPRGASSTMRCRRTMSVCNSFPPLCLRRSSVLLRRSSSTSGKIASCSIRCQRGNSRAGALIPCRESMVMNA